MKKIKHALFILCKNLFKIIRIENELNIFYCDFMIKDIFFSTNHLFDLIYCVGAYYFITIINILLLHLHSFNF